MIHTTPITTLFPYTTLFRSDLAIAKSAPLTVVAGTDLTFHLVVTNNGPSTSSGGTVSDVVPAQTTFVSAAGCTNTSGTVSCPVGPLAPRATASFDITAPLAPTAT